MGAIASQITSLPIVYSTLYSDADQRKHQSSAWLAFVRRIHRDRWIPRTNGQLRGKCFHLMTSSCIVFAGRPYRSVRGLLWSARVSSNNSKFSGKLEVFKCWGRVRHGSSHPHAFRWGMTSLQLRHNERDGVSNHRRIHCLLNCWFRHRSNKISKLRVTGLCVGKSPVTGDQ